MPFSMVHSVERGGIEPTTDGPRRGRPRRSYPKRSYLESDSVVVDRAQDGVVMNRAAQSGEHGAQCKHNEDRVLLGHLSEPPLRCSAGVEPPYAASAVKLPTGQSSRFRLDRASSIIAVILPLGQRGHVVGDGNPGALGGTQMTGRGSGREKCDLRGARFTRAPLTAADR